MKLTESQIARIQALEDAGGRLTPERVVDDARDKASPLHVLFDWNIKRAAAKHWLMQARDVIASVSIVVRTQTYNLKTPVYMRDPDAPGDKQGYRNVSELKRDPAQAREALISTLEVASGHLRRAMTLAEPLGLANEIDQLVEQVMGMRRLLSEAA